VAEPLWVDKALLLQLHDEIVTETGGARGIRSKPLLESALARSINRYAYEGLEDLVELAATYAVAISSNHPFYRWKQASSVRGARPVSGG
jgi:death-on-curing protein